MDIYLYGASAQRAIRTARITREFALVPSDRRWVTPCHPGQIPAATLKLLRGFADHDVVHLRTPRRSRHRKYKDFQLHVTSEQLPAHSFYELVPTGGQHGSLTAAVNANESLDERVRIFVDAPTLQVAWLSYQMQRLVLKGRVTENYALLRTVGYVMELCGCYALVPSGQGCERGSYRLSPLLGVADLSRLLNEARNLKGLKLARKAVALAGDNSASPMESLLFLLFSLPANRGGLGYSGVLINTPIDPKLLKEVGAAHDQLTPDLQMWELHVVFEFESRFAHDVYWDAPLDSLPDELLMAEDAAMNQAARDQFREDRLRAQDYQALGLSMIPVTAEDLVNANMFAAFAKRVASAIDRWQAGAKRVTELDRVRRLTAKADWQRHAMEVIHAFRPWTHGM
jgi:hypothetical protein